MRRSVFLVWSILVLAVAGATALVVAPGADSAGGGLRLVKEWSGWEGQVSCGVPFDPLVAFARPADAEYGHLPSEVALRRYLAKTRHWYTHSPPHPWRLLVETSHHAVFARGDLSKGLVETNQFERGPKGWRWSGSGGCQPSLLRNHREAITWTLPTDQKLTPATTQVRVNLGPGECAGGKSQNERLEKPLFREENGALLMALWIRPVPPGHSYTCVGIIEPPVTIQLPGPLGDREILDGGVFPPLSSARQQRLDEGV
jgi:hypothetical protein